MAPIKEWFGAYNIIFRWFKERYGENALEEYWRFIALNCFGDVIEKFKIQGLEGIDDYYKETFKKDDGEYTSELQDGSLVFEVKRCPDFDFMKSSPNPYFSPLENYCRHHEIINSIIAQKAGYSFCMKECSNEGQCKWIFKEADKE